MLVARRLYLYFVAGVSLAVLAAGLVNLLELGLQTLWEALTGTQVIFQPPGAVRRELSLYSALTVVALPIWLLHWWLIERVLAPGRAEAELERHSLVRALYVTILLFVSFLLWANAALDLLQWAFEAVLDVSEPFTMQPAAEFVIGRLAVLVVLGGIWIYHAWIVLRDRRASALSGGADWLPRLYLYVGAAFGLVTLLAGASQLIQTLVDALFGRGEVVAGDLRRVLAQGSAWLLGGFVVWSLHWGYSLGLRAQPDWRGEHERRSLLRWVYLYLGVFAGVALTLGALAVSLAELFRWALGVDTGDTSQRVQAVVEPPLLMLPVTLLWLYHRRQIHQEAEGIPEAGWRVSVGRLIGYLSALAGLAFAGSGLALLLGMLFDLLLGGSRVAALPPGWWRGQVSGYGAVTLVGGLAWLWYWYAALRRVAAEPVAERASLSRRAYLYIVLAVTIVGLLGGLAFVLYRFLGWLLGVTGGAQLVSDISVALGVVIVAGLLLAYHALTLRQDLREVAERLPAERTVRLTLRLPTDIDPEQAVEELRRHLPPGVELEVAG
ncbi:hypothetical protein HRbin26_00912 [bacterium HR26]|nr:hypothetical protein HRbin26_00912 [bacterium HR26]